MDTDNQLHQPLVKQVLPPEVHQLVAHRMAEILLRQAGGGEHDTGPAQPQKQRGGCQGIDAELHGSPDAALLPQAGQAVQLLRLLHRLPPRPDIGAKALVSGGLPNQKCQGHPQPRHPQGTPKGRPASCWGRLFGR